MNKKNTVLIAEDSELNRKILTKILSPDYDIIAVENGQQAMDELEKNPFGIVALLLDLVMPVMNGYQVMEAMSIRDEFKNIPIIVVTASAEKEDESSALAMGAWDYVSKPYNPQILLFRLCNAIERSKLNFYAVIKHQAEHDSLTGLYNASKFYQATRVMINANPLEKFVIIRYDIERFRQYNSMYGRYEGDKFLKYVAELTKKYLGNENKIISTYGRIEADVFAVCASYHSLEALKAVIRDFQNEVHNYNTRFDFEMIVGIYVIDDRKLLVNEMFDRATLAAKTRKGVSLNSIVEYTYEMGEKIRAEQEIVNQMNEALENEQYQVFYQPKYDIINNRLIGAEALVRWNHPEKGLVYPGAFIPIFERNGFIANVDYFVWKKTCENLKRWIDAGWGPKPISVNVSRVNLNNPQICEIIMKLLNEYKIDPRLFQIEITETAYMDNPEIMKNVVDEFHNNGLTVLMDDFGSGYSSLNTLKEITVDILKVDMKFLPAGQNDTKSEIILESVINMAKRLGMPVIVEGVETQDQVDFLKNVGSYYVQGYFYGRPTPVSNYEKLFAEQSV